MLLAVVPNDRIRSAERKPEPSVSVSRPVSSGVREKTAWILSSLWLQLRLPILPSWKSLKFRGKSQ
jgi:hypothetical protein